MLAAMPYETFCFAEAPREADAEFAMAVGSLQLKKNLA